ncbi:MAG: succinylglutamate desuccinylase [Planctomycetes bacterium]|nr:succinylglutamate desuccinylase [Planctomycetota bacterium]
MPTAYELKTHRICGAAEGPHLLITAGVHGDEFEGVAAIHRLMNCLDAADISGCVTLVPVVNESAYDLRGRCGKDGLDLARTCPGRADGSRTEQVAHALAELIQSADLYIDLHAGGVVMDVYPLAGYGLVQSADVLAKQRRMAEVFGLPLVWGTTSDLDGRSMSVARDAEVPAIYIEYRGGGRCDPRGVDALFDGCRRVMAEFQIIDKFEQQRSRSAVYEDARPDSGHMQNCYPAPREGLFEPSVRLGQRVEAGESIGCLSDSYSGKRQMIAATEPGAVIVLRTYPRVDQGDSLAVVLEDAEELPSC